MRRADREIGDPSAVRRIMEEAKVCRLGLCHDGEPYVVPVCFGLGEGCLYFHCAPAGRKLEMIRRNSRVCFEMDRFLGLVASSSACGCSAAYESVIGFGRAVVLEDPKEKALGLERIMEHYGFAGPFRYEEGALLRTAVVRIEIISLTAKGRAKEIGFDKGAPLR